jgi:hypothetical protein
MKHDCVTHPSLPFCSSDDCCPVSANLQLWSKKTVTQAPSYHNDALQGILHAFLPPTYRLSTTLRVPFPPSTAEALRRLIYPFVHGFQLSGFSLDASPKKIIIHLRPCLSFGVKTLTKYIRMGWDYRGKSRFHSTLEDGLMRVASARHQ